MAAVAPSWRWDSLAVAYVRADGRVAVHTATSGHNTVIPPNCGLRHPTALAFAPTSGLLAIADRTRLRIVDTTGGAPDVCAAHSPGAPSIAWVRPHQLFVAAGATLYRYLLLQPGLGTDATRLTLDWAFNMLGLHNVMLTVLPTNTAAIRTYEKAGFKRIGVRRDSLSVMGRRGDEVLMDAVASEFDSPVLAARR